MSIDPQCEKYYWISPYAYCANNPIRYVDPTGEFIESAWDVFSLVTGAKSFVDNVKAGNVGAAIVDGLGVVVDAAAVVVPGVPGGVGAATKGIRAVDKAVDATRVVDKGTDAAKALDNTTDISKQAKREAPAKSRAKWEEATGEKWPKDPQNPSKNQYVSHKKALADGGTNDVDNIEPKPHREHMDEHKQNGDFKRWGKRRNNND